MKRCLLSILPAFAPVCLIAQMQMGGPAQTLKENVLRHSTSGTSLDPESSAPPMLMRMSGKWTEMLHGEVGVAEQQQTSPRGRDKLFSVNWAMAMAQRTTAQGQWTFVAMFSLEPATVTGRYYPELFQQGETAFGKAIVDGQHPHNLFMELAAIYDMNLGNRVLASLNAAPVGDPALGPVAFPHRSSAESDPLAPLAHHLQDSTHIAYDVVTGGLTWGPARLEASGFHGREPSENRWIIEQGAVDSWSVRLTAAPARDWIAQYSIGHLHSPESLHPGEDVLRQTASVGAHHAWTAAEIDATAIWGRNHTAWAGHSRSGHASRTTTAPRIFLARQRRRKKPSWAACRPTPAGTRTASGNPIGARWNWARRPHSIQLRRDCCRTTAPTP
jgi:hypothetical protein